MERMLTGRKREENNKKYSVESTTSIEPEFGRTLISGFNLMLILISTYKVPMSADTFLVS